MISRGSFTIKNCFITYQQKFHLHSNLINDYSGSKIAKNCDLLLKCCLTSIETRRYLNCHLKLNRHCCKLPYICRLNCFVVRQFPSTCFDEHQLRHNQMFVQNSHSAKSFNIVISNSVYLYVCIFSYSLDFSYAHLYTKKFAISSINEFN